MLTVLIRAAAEGDRDAEEELFRVVYDDLRRIACRGVGKKSARSVLQPTALVHEAFLKLFRGAGSMFPDRFSFFAAAARVMERQMIDEYRRSLVRGTESLPEGHPAPLGEQGWAAELALAEQLARLRAAHPRAARALLLHSFGELTREQVATAMGVGHATVERDVRFARAWLHTRLFPDS